MSVVSVAGWAGFGITLVAARQLLRPSFYRYVRRLLDGHRLTSLPIFVRPVEIIGVR
ncbi:hypothetical protein V4U86_26425 [Mycobacterium sp. AMU20-3851]|uniref:hypothetical protein n=1 Tax=Mycobacterium sp. AMU20-3851 TaxID=3122055 RepID=UPI00375457A3